MTTLAKTWGSITWLKGGNLAASSLFKMLVHTSWCQVVPFCNSCCAQDYNTIKHSLNDCDAFGGSGNWPTRSWQPIGLGGCCPSCCTSCNVWGWSWKTLNSRAHPLHKKIVCFVSFQPLLLGQTLSILAPTKGAKPQRWAGRIAAKPWIRSFDVGRNFSQH